MTRLLGMFCHLLSSIAVREEHNATSNPRQARRGAGEPAMRATRKILHSQLLKFQQDDVVRSASLWGREPALCHLGEAESFVEGQRGIAGGGP